MPTRQALELAEERGLDLVEVAPAASPPVCRLMDYGKFRYEATRKEREARRDNKAKSINELREVRFKTRIGEHDRAAKTRLVRRLLDTGSEGKGQRDVPRQGDHAPRGRHGGAEVGS